MTNGLPKKGYLQIWGQHLQAITKRWVQAVAFDALHWRARESYDKDT